MAVKTDTAATGTTLLSAQFADLAKEVAELARDPASFEIGALARLVSRLQGEFSLVAAAPSPARIVDAYDEDLEAVFDRSLPFQPLVTEQIEMLAGILRQG